MSKKAYWQTTTYLSPRVEIDMHTCQSTDLSVKSIKYLPFQQKVDILIAFAAHSITKLSSEIWIVFFKSMNESRMVLLKRSWGGIDQ